MNHPTAHDRTVENISVLTYAVMARLRESMLQPTAPDDVCMGMLMGLAMFMDDQVGPQQMALLMRETPGIILRTDAHVPMDRLGHFAPFLRAFGRDLTTVDELTLAMP